MKLLKAILLVPVLLALLAGTALAKSAPQPSGVDSTFGHEGTIDVAVPKGAAERSIQMATAPSGKSYVLAGSWLLAFGANGRPDFGFGHNGRVQVAAASGETTEVTGLAVDVQGRVLVSGSVDPTPGVPNQAVPPQSAYALFHPAPSNAFVTRYLPDGERDPAFGGSGEIDITLTPPARPGPADTTAHFEHPSVHADRLAIVNGEQPVLGGTYWYYVDYCYFTGVSSYGFAAPIDAFGPATQTLAPTAYTQFRQSNVYDFAPMPAGNLAVLLSDRRSSCSDRGEPETSTLSALTFGGAPAPALDPAGPQVWLDLLAVDGQGRILGLEPPSSRGQFSKLIRLLPNGAFDPSFGENGGTPLKKFGEEPIGGIVTDAKGRITVAGGEGKFRLVRFGSKGKIDHSFGKHGWVEVGFGPHTQATPGAMTVDANGRILVAGRVTNPSLTTGEGIGLVRINPTR
jgi:uncharacterized delta-60 repeat protein